MRHFRPTRAHAGRGRGNRRGEAMKAGQPPAPTPAVGESGADQVCGRSLLETGGQQFLLRLYVCGMAPNSLRAIENVRNICREHLEGRHFLEIIDIYRQPGLAREGQVVAVPALVKVLPLPLRRLIGDFSRPEQVLRGLGLGTKG